MEQVKQIVFTAPKKAEYLVADNMNIENIGEHQIVIKSMFTTVSAGTERANLIGDPNVAPDKSAGSLFPKVLGYNCAGEVVKIGSRVKSVKVGDRVVMYWSGHRNYNIAEEWQVVKID